MVNETQQHSQHQKKPIGTEITMQAAMAQLELHNSLLHASQECTAILLLKSKMLQEIGMGISAALHQLLRVMLPVSRSRTAALLRSKFCNRTAPSKASGSSSCKAKDDFECQENPCKATSHTCNKQSLRQLNLQSQG